MPTPLPQRDTNWNVSYKPTRSILQLSARPNYSRNTDTPCIGKIATNWAEWYYFSSTTTYSMTSISYLHQNGLNRSQQAYTFTTTNNFCLCLHIFPQLLRSAVLTLLTCLPPAIPGNSRAGYPHTVLSIKRL